MKATHNVPMYVTSVDHTRAYAALMMVYSEPYSFAIHLLKPVSLEFRPAIPQELWNP